MPNVFTMAVLLGFAVPVSAQGSHESAVRREELRVARIAFAIATASAAPCPRTGAQPGFALHHLAEYEVADRPLAAQRHGLDAGPAVSTVVADSPAASAGLRTDDVILRISGVKVTPVPDLSPEDARPSIEALESRTFAALSDRSNSIEILRDGVLRQIQINAAPGCPVRVRLAQSRQVNAFARRGYAIVTTGFLDFVKSDDELAVAIGHEMAHVLLAHPDGKTTRAQEADADRLGLKLAWAGGYDIRQATNLWRRLARRAIIQLPIGHLVAAERDRIVREVLEELRESQPGAQAPQLGEGALPER